jgi:ornithine cyclodeaminase
MRTAALSSTATKWLADEKAETMAIMGSGHQALPQVSAVVKVRPIKHVKVWSRTPENRKAFVEDIRKAYPNLKVYDCETTADACKDAQVITTFTRAKEPFVMSDMVAKGTHINAGGAIIPTNAEIDPAIFPRCAVVACDNLPQVQKGSKELMDFVASGKGSWDKIYPLNQVVYKKMTRPKDADLTIYKFMGYGLADLASATEIYKRAIAKGVGKQYPHPKRSEPKLL